MDCKDCKEQDRECLATIPYVDYQGNLHREIRRARGWMAAFFVSFCLLLVTNTWWCVHNSQENAISSTEDVTYETETYEPGTLK